MSETSNADSATETEHVASVETEASRYVPPPEPPSAVAAAPQKKRGGFWLLLILFLMMSGSSYFAYQLWLQLHNSQAQQAQQSSAASAALQQDIDTLKQQWQALQTPQLELQQQVNTLEQQQQALQKAYTQLYNKQRRTGDADDWSAAEVGYLLRIAQQRLSLGQDVEAALSALRAADQRLRHAGALFLPVREQLTHDIQQLQSVEMPDIEGMALALAGYAKRTETLPLLQGKGHQQPLQPQAETEQAPTADTSWPAVADTLWSELRKLVVIRYNDSADTGLLSPPQRAFLRDNLRLKLATARLLLLNRDTEQFRLEIKSLLTWLQRYYDVQDKAVDAMRTDLQRMQTVALQPELPDVSQSLAVLQPLNRAASSEPVIDLTHQEQVAQ